MTIGCRGDVHGKELYERVNCFARGVAKNFLGTYHPRMNDDLLKRIEALEKRVADLEAKAVPVTPDLFPVAPAPEPKIPTKPMIERWVQNRKNKGLGPERSMSRHAAAFSDMYKRCNGDLPTALVAIDRYFKDSRHWVVERGWNLDLFQKMMDGLALEAKRYVAPSTATVRAEPAPVVEPAGDRVSGAEVLERLRKKVKRV
jgi:hypothetical protein